MEGNNNQQNNRTYGTHGEEKAVRYLQQNGYIVLARNFTAFGIEIDILAKKEIQQEMHFFMVEVKRVRAGYYRAGYPVVRMRQLNRYKNARQRWFVRENRIFNVHISLILLSEDLSVLDFFPYWA